MWIKTQIDGTGNYLVNLDKVEAIIHLPNTMDSNGTLVAELGGDAEYYGLFEGTQEDCEACLDWILSGFYCELPTADINDWIESRKPVDPGKFSEIVGEVREKDDIPF